jgi:molecular chaperone GrpE
MKSTENINTPSDECLVNESDDVNTTNLQENEKSLSDNPAGTDNLTVPVDENLEKEKTETEQEPSWEQKYVSLNDTYLRLMAEYDNYRKRTVREKAELIKSGGESVLKNLLPVVDDFDRALESLKKAEDMKSAIEGVQLIYDKFISYLLQQGVKKMNTVGTSFDADMYDAIATLPVPEEDKKGKVIDCIQAGYVMYDKVLRHAKVVVGA